MKNPSSISHYAHDQSIRETFWHEVTDSSLVTMNVFPLDARLSSSRESFLMPGLLSCRAQGVAQQVIRSEADIRQSNENSFYLLTQSTLAWTCEHSKRNVAVLPGDCVLIDTRLPFTLSYSQGLDVFTLRLPISLVERWVPHTADLVGRPIDGSQGWGLALKGATEALAPRAIAEYALAQSLIEDLLGSLLALSCGASKPATVDSATLERCMQAMRDMLHVPGLVASDVAVVVGISVRTLHRTFADRHLKFATTLMRLRIDHACSMLENRRFVGLSIAEIGRRCGFLDPSHFSRQFRKNRGMTPYAFRNGRCNPFAVS